MNIKELEERFLGKKVSINWSLADKTKNLTGFGVSDSVCVVKEIIQNCHGEIFALFVDIIYVPVRIERLNLI